MKSRIIGYAVLTLGGLVATEFFLIGDELIKPGDLLYPPMIRLQ